jgi:hypothetical protein
VTPHRTFRLLSAPLLTCLGLTALAACGSGSESHSAAPSDSLPRLIAGLPWKGHLASGDAIRVAPRGTGAVGCVDVHTGPGDSSDYCITDLRTKPLDAATQLDCGTGDALLVGSVARRDMTVQLLPDSGPAQNAIQFRNRTTTGSRRLVLLSFPASRLPAHLLVLGSGNSVLDDHRIASQDTRCGDDASKLLFGWL